MTSYLPSSHATQVSPILYTATSLAVIAKEKAKEVFRILDTVAEEQAVQNTKQIVAGARPPLNAPAPLPLSRQSDLLILAEAFCKAFDSMNQGILSETQDYVQLQQLDQTQTNAVLSSTTNAINKQQAAEKVASKIAAYEQHWAEMDKIFGWVVFGIGLLMTGLTAGASLGASFAVDIGITLAGVSEDALFEVGDDVGEEVIDEVSSVEEQPEENVNVDVEGVESEEVATQNPAENTEEVSEQTTKALDSNSAQNAESEQSMLKKVGKFLLKMGISAGFASPMLLKGIYGIKVAGQKHELAEAQKIIGSALSTVQRNNMYFQFLQDLLQRQGGIMQQEASDASEIVDTFASITSAWRGISTGLAQAV